MYTIPSPSNLSFSQKATNTFLRTNTGLYRLVLNSMYHMLCVPVLHCPCVFSGATDRVFFFFQFQKTLACVHWLISDHWVWTHLFHVFVGHWDIFQLFKSLYLERPCDNSTLVQVHLQSSVETCITVLNVQFRSFYHLLFRLNVFVSNWGHRNRICRAQACCVCWFETDCVFTTLIGSMDLGEWGLKMRQTKVSYNSYLYSELQTIYTLRVK